MSYITTVKNIVDDEKLFNELSERNYVRLMDTPRIWGEPFGKEIMPIALARAREFQQVVAEIIQKTRFRCDVSSLNSPDPAWTKVILDAMDHALTDDDPQFEGTIQFRFLFGQTPTMLQTGTPPNFIDFQGSLMRLVRARWNAWHRKPEIWFGRFFRLQEGITSGLGSYVKSSIPGVSWVLPDDEDASTKMTWNHSKIIVSDGAEALVGGHNLNMDLFTSYPPVHDVSVAIHGGAAHGAQMYLNQMWACKSDLLFKEYLKITDGGASVVQVVQDDKLEAQARKPEDPLARQQANEHRLERYRVLGELHGRPIGEKPVKEKRAVEQVALSIREDDLQTLRDIEEPLFEARVVKDSYAKLQEYKAASRVLSVGKYWASSGLKDGYKPASELMKRELILGARRSLKLSQMDLISAWKKSWQSHVVCRWIMEALIKNPDLVVQVVVSPLNAGAGAEGDQYSFGSGACRTFDLIQYYMKHGLDGKVLPDADLRLEALKRFHIAPLYFTQVPENQTEEGGSYHWPDLDLKGHTQTIRQPSLKEKPPVRGVIGDAVEAVKMGSGQFSKYKKVPSAPGNHAKVMVVDDESYVVGSDNLYPGFLSEFNYLIEGQEAVGDLLDSYWKPLWWYSGQHCVNPNCQGGCKELGAEQRPVKHKLSTTPFGATTGANAPLLDPRNAGKVRRIKFLAPLPPPLKPPEKKKDALVLESSQDVSQDEKVRRARAFQGMEAQADDGDCPDLTPPEYFFTEDDIYQLQRYYLRDSPDIAVLAGVISYQWDEMTAAAYTTEFQPAITRHTRTILQPFHVNGNHWALLCITRGQEGDGTPPRLLYIDPLNPEVIPVERLALLRRPFPKLEAERALVRYQKDNGLGGSQNSCGAWVVHLAQQLAFRPFCLPNPEANRHLAALKLRAAMNEDLRTARLHPGPVAPVNRGDWVT